MSGGHWEYKGAVIRDTLEAMANDPEVRKRWPILGELLGKLSPVLYGIENDMDWDLSYDSAITDDRKFEEDSIAAIHKAAIHALVFISNTPLPPCPVCGEHAMRKLTGDFLADIGFDGLTVRVPFIERERCDKCGEEIFSLEASREIHTAVDAARKALNP